MGDFIEQLYLGTLDPQGLSHEQDNRLSELATQLERLEQQLSHHLQGDDLALFLRFCNLSAEFSGAERLESFTSGFRLGAGFGLDVFGVNEQ